MKYNAVLSVLESGLGAEPITGTELKNYLRLEGFTDSDESTSESLSDFDFDDSLITDIITAARQAMEKGTGISLVTKTIAAAITNLRGRIEIPYGPVGTISSLVDSDGDAIVTDDYTVVGNEWKFLVSPCYQDMVITYTAGYSTLPKAIKIDLLRLAGYMFINRGDDQGIQKFTSQLAKKYSRNTFLM